MESLPRTVEDVIAEEVGNFIVMLMVLEWNVQAHMCDGQEVSTYFWPYRECVYAFKLTGWG